MLGAHMSISGGICNSLYRGLGVGCNVIQIFTKNSTRWKAKRLEASDIAKFRIAEEETAVSAIAAHDSYLINFGTSIEENRERAVDAFYEEVERTEALDIPYLIFHPGSHLGTGVEEGIIRIAHSLNIIIERSEGFRVKLILETTAGQGSNIGYRFEQLRDIIKRVYKPERIGICFDTCHVFAAGYDIRDRQGYEKTFEQFEDILGIDYIKVFHLNDSKKELCSRVDRHEHIGKGFIGIDAFKYLLNDKRFKNIPMILETPKGKDMKEDVMNLTTLRGLF
ncbi:MAG: deoxyribonuclease IV [Nitrospirota bacterium]